jgi:hypothetical protein
VRPLCMDDLRNMVAGIELGPHAPVAIREQFDTARNAFVYSWFAEPRGVLGGEVEGDAMLRPAQERFTGCFGGKYAGLAYDAEIAFETAMAGDRADNRLREMDVEIVAKRCPTR